MARTSSRTAGTGANGPRLAIGWLIAAAIAAALGAACTGTITGRLDSVDAAGPCGGVTCSGHGACVADGVVVRCECDEPYHVEGLECLPPDEWCNLVDDDADGEVDEGCLCPARPRADLSVEPEDASWPRGGGVDYPDIVDVAYPCTVEARTAVQLQDALARARPDMTVFVPADAEIDLTGKSLCIPAGVWLAGDRGRAASAGGLIYTTGTTKTPILKSCGAGVRITGLRVRGADFQKCPDSYYTNTCSAGNVICRDCEPVSIGILVTGDQPAWNLEVDNCDLSGWSLAAVSVNTTGNRVHHNYIHHTQRHGLGYGVLLSWKSPAIAVQIDHNVFDYYRHAVAGSGGLLQSYEAHHNTATQNTIGHVFDMHNVNESDTANSIPAGQRVDVHHNEILPAGAYSLVVRGVPTEGSWFYGNCTGRTEGTAALQQHHFGNFWVDYDPAGASVPNTYGQAPAACLAPRFCVALNGQGLWKKGLRSTLTLADLGFGDFDGDGRTDVFWTQGDNWMWSRSGTEPPEVLAAGSPSLSQLHFGDFDKDGATDVFYADGSSWRYRSGGRGSWVLLRSAAEVVGLVFGDFDGDGTTDVLRADGATWFWSRGGVAAFEPRRSSTVLLENVKLGDFDGDGTTDAFRANGAAWSLSRAAAGPWETLSTSTYALSDLLLGDFDGDGKSDVLRTATYAWWMSSGGTGPWRRLAVESHQVPNLVIGDFDGNGKADVFRTGCLH